VSPADLLRFAGGALSGHRLRSGLSLLGVAIGVGSVILLTSLGEGARRYVTGEFAVLGSNLLVVIPGKVETSGTPPIFGGSTNDLTLEDAEAVERRAPLVQRVVPLTVVQVKAQVGPLARDVVVAGVTPSMKRVRKIEVPIGQYLPEGDIDRGARVAVLGAKVAQELFPGRSPLGETIRLGDERFRVIGVMGPRGTSLGENLDEVIHVPVARGLKLANRRGLFRLLIETTSYQDTEAAKQQVLEILKERHDGVEDVTVLTQDAVLSTFSRILTILTAALAGIAAISLSVAGVGIMNVMLVSVSERTREIGLMKALGVTRWQVVAVFLAEAAILSALGGIVGVALGLLLGRAVTAVYPDFPVAAPAWAVAAALLVSIGVGLVFGVLPARRAAGLDPVAALAGK